jgi:hypothetical protein
VLSLIFRIVRIALASLATVYFGSALAIAALAGTPLAAGPAPYRAALMLFLSVAILGFELVDWRRRNGT